MEGGQSQRLMEDSVEDLVVSLSHHQMGGLRMMGWRMGKSDEICLGCGEVIDGYIDGGNLGGLD